MATGTRTLKLSILADVDDLKKKLGEADKAVETNANKVSDFGKKAAKAFAVAAVAATAYAGKLLIDGVRAAIEDEKANAQLAATLTNVAGATDNTIKSVLAYSRATELATGVTEDELRPSLNRLAIATKDANEAMRLQKIALDVAAGSGKGLDAVTTALAKAFEGNTTSLGRLGIGLSAAELKTMSFEDITKSLSNTFGGQADVAANTFEGRIKRLQLTFEDARDSLAERLLPFIERFINLVINTVIPKLKEFAENFNPIKDAIADNQEAFDAFGQFIQTIIIPILVTGLGAALKTVGVIAGGVVDIIGKVISAIQASVDAAIAGINALIARYNAIPILPNISPIGSSAGVSSAASVATTATATSTATTATAAQIAAGAARAGTTVNNITVQSVDSEGSARAVAKVLNQSASRSVPQLYNGGITRAR
jgi:hypothetical protein